LAALIKSFISTTRSDESGQGLVEYALILVLVAIVVIAALTLLGPTIGGIFSEITNELGAESHVCEPWPNCG